MDIKTHYDLLIEENNDPFREPPALRQYMESWDGQVFQDLMELDPSKTVLEIGVGTGRIAGKTAGYCHHLTGIDISPKTIGRARDNLRHYQNITLICDDFSTHIFQETYDIIYSTLTMMHFQDKSFVISKISTLLNDGGLICLSIDKNQSKWIDMGDRRIRIYPDTPQRIIASAEQAGLRAKRLVEIENAHIVVLVK